MTAVTDLTRLFSGEQRYTEHLLGELVAAFERGELSRARGIVREVLEACGPRFRYEEEALFPRLAATAGPELVESLLWRHDAVIRALRRLAVLTAAQAAGSSADPNSDLAAAAVLSRAVLADLRDDGRAAALVDTLPVEDVYAVLSCREHAVAHGLDLLEWVDTGRRRPA